MNPVLKTYPRSKILPSKYTIWVITEQNNSQWVITLSDDLPYFCKLFSRIMDFAWPARAFHLIFLQSNLNTKNNKNYNFLWTYWQISNIITEYFSKVNK